MMPRLGCQRLIKANKKGERAYKKLSTHSAKEFICSLALQHVKVRGLIPLFTPKNEKNTKLQPPLIVIKAGTKTSF